MVELARALRKAEIIEVKGNKIKELINFSFILQDATNCICTLAERKLDMEYLCAELLWYLSCDSSCSSISAYASLWNKISVDGKVQSNYGIPLFREGGMSFMLDRLIEDKHSRQAVCPLNSQEHRQNLKDLPCTMYVHLYIRNDYLNLKVTMRSNDLIYGLCYDIVFFSMVQQIAYLMLKKYYPELKLGYYYHEADSLHVYSKHFAMAGALASSPLMFAPVTLFELDSDFLLDMAKGTHNRRIMKKLYETSHYPALIYQHAWMDRFINK